MSNTAASDPKKKTELMVATIKDQRKPHAARCNALVTLASEKRDTYLRSFSRNEQDLFLSGLQSVLSGKNGQAIINCSPESLFRFLKDCSSYRFHVGGAYPDAYPVPFNGHVSTIVSWRGLVKLGARSGELAKPPVVTAVYEGEDLGVAFDDGELDINHGYNPANPHRAALNDAKIIAVYLVATFNSGAKTRILLTRDQIEAHKRRYSKGWNRPDSAWQTNWGAMAFKTILRVAFNRGLLPISVEDRRAGAAELMGRDDDTGEVIEAAWEPSVADDAPALPHTEDPNEGGIDPVAVAKDAYLSDLDNAEAESSPMAAGIAFDRCKDACGTLWSSELEAWAIAEREATIKKINERRRA